MLLITTPAWLIRRSKNTPPEMLKKRAHTRVMYATVTVQAWLVQHSKKKEEKKQKLKKCTTHTGKNGGEAGNYNCEEANTSQTKSSGGTRSRGGSSSSGGGGGSNSGSGNWRTREREGRGAKWAREGM